MSNFEDIYTNAMDEVQLSIVEVDRIITKIITENKSLKEENEKLKAKIDKRLKDD